jgi:hypothetical protein
LIKFGRKIVKHAKFENRKENVLKGQIWSGNIAKRLSGKK